MSPSVLGILNEKAFSMWNSFDNFKKFDVSDLIAWDFTIPFRLWLICIAHILCPPGLCPDLFLPESRFEESMHYLLSYSPLALDVLINCEQLMHRLSCIHKYMCVACLCVFTFCLGSRSAAEKTHRHATQMYFLLTEKTLRKIIATFNTLHFLSKQRHHS